MKKVTSILLVFITAGLFMAGPALGVDGENPLMRDFMGICVHTVQFKPELYKPICRQVRDYHGLEWDVGKDTDHWPQFPFARNRVDWQKMYGSWKDAGFEINASIMFGGIGQDEWKDIERDAETYGFAFARYFGPGSRNLVGAMEIGNEPGDYDDKTYRKVFENMAKGARAGDPKMKIATCAATVGESEKYAKSLDCVKGLEGLYDVINFHSYAQVEGWPTWRRSYPEDGSIEFLKKAQEIIDWRNSNASDKEIWITEFGWDAGSKKAPETGTFKDWEGSTQLQQAQYLVRAYLIFSAMDIDRAYMYWFNDDDKPQVHGSSGLTRNYKPKPSYYAVSHLYKTLGDYRFNRIVKQESDDLYIYEYRHEAKADEIIWVVWSPTGSGRKVSKTVVTGAKPYKAERMPLSAGNAEDVRLTSGKKEQVDLQCDENPVYLWIRLP